MRTQGVKELVPGTHLSQTETRLQSSWSNPIAYPFPVLRGIQIEGQPGLRGIQKAEIKFPYPVVAIAGKNGSGKSTLLALAALAYHAPEGHFSRHAKVSVQGGRAYYTFRDFIFRGVGDPELTGLTITWRYERESPMEVKIRKSTEKWMHYDRRPERPVHYLGISRCVPAIEQSVLRSHFTSSRNDLQTEGLQDLVVDGARKILGRHYSSAERLSSGSYELRKCTSETEYSGFNMGAGEDVTFEVLALLHEAPLGSLFVVEEVELGLHPEATRRLAETLIEVALKRKLQIIVSTHSEDFLDALPRVGRILIQRCEGELVATESPTTRLCVGQMTGTNEPELLIYCEDDVPELILEQVLPLALRKRVQIVPIGADSELAKARYIHEKQSNSAKALVLWDGDVADEKIRNWLSKDLAGRGVDLSGVSFSRIPGDAPPERFVASVLANGGSDLTMPAVKLEFNCGDAEATEILDSLASADDKDIAHKIGVLTSRERAETFRCLVRAAKSVDSARFQPLVEEIERVLDGEVVQIQSALPEDSPH